MNLSRLLLLPVCLAVACSPMAPEDLTGTTQQEVLPEPPLDSATAAAFARVAVPVLYGRKPRNHDEVQVIADMVRSGGREATARLLMNSPEFRTHWTDVLSDFLQIDRTEGSMKGNPACFRTNAVYDAAGLASHIRRSPPSSAFSIPGLNMADVIRSSLAADDAYPAYKAGLLALNARSITMACIGEPERRADHADHFVKTYLNRDLVCSGCHRADYSETGRRPELVSSTTHRAIDSSWESRTVYTGSMGPDVVLDWNRTHTATGFVENAIWAGAIGTQDRRPLEGFFNTTQRTGSPMYGLDSSCGSFGSSSSAVPGDFGDTGYPNASLTTLVQLLDTGRRAITPRAGHFGGLDLSPRGDCSICSTSGACRTTAVGPDPGASDREARVRTFIADNCISCHGTGAPASAYVNLSDFPASVIRQRGNRSGRILVTPRNRAESELYRRIESLSDPMPPSYAGGHIAGAELVFGPWIDGLSTRDGCAVCMAETCRGAVPRKEDAFAYVVAQGLANRIYAQVMGERLNAPHGLSRNKAQRDMLVELTDVELLANDKWSVKNVIARIMASDDFARELIAPGATTPYDMPMTTNPWSQKDMRWTAAEPKRWTDPDIDPTRFDNHQHYNNSVGDRVKRHPAQVLVKSIYSALGWKAADGTPLQPSRFPVPGTPEYDALRAMGLYLDNQNTGGRGVNLQGLVAYEKNVFSCVRPSHALITPQDYVQFLAARAATATKRELAEALRDRLLGDARLPAAEVTALQTAAFFGTGSLSGMGGTPAAMETALRNYCAALVVSPQFLLSGLEDDGVGPRPALAGAGFDAEPTTYTQTCEQLRDATFDIRYMLDCSTTPARLGEGVIVRWEDICPRGSCIWQRIPDLELCPACLDRIRFPERGVDPREGWTQRYRGDMAAAIWFGDGAKVTRVSGAVSVLRAKSQGFTAAKLGDTLYEGDLLRIGAGADFELSTKNAVSKAPPGGMPKGELGLDYFIKITGPSYAKPVDVGYDGPAPAPQNPAGNDAAGTFTPNSVAMTAQLKLAVGGVLDGASISQSDKLALNGMVLGDEKGPFDARWEAWSYKADGRTPASAVVTLGTTLQTSVMLKDKLQLDASLCQNGQAVALRLVVQDPKESRVAQQQLALSVRCP